MNRLINLFYHGTHGMFIEPGAWMSWHDAAQAYLKNPTALQPRSADGDEPSSVAPPLDEKQLAKNRIGYLWLSGTVAKRVAFDVCAPDTFLDLARFDRNLRAMAEDEDIDKILLHLDTPGGYGLGLEVSNRLIAEVAKSKPVYTYTDTMQASAGIWGFCSATEKFCSSDAVVGSIGSYMVLFNQMRQMEKLGIDVTVMRSGTFKGAGHPLKELTEDEAQMFRDDLEHHAEKFRACVESQTGLDRKYMEGQTFEGSEAVDIGLMDMVVDSPEELVSMLASHG